MYWFGQQYIQINKDPNKTSATHFELLVAIFYEESVSKVVNKYNKCRLQQDDYVVK